MSKRGFTDRELLRALDWKDQGISMGTIAKRMCVSRSAILGATQRVLAACPSDSQHDGTLPRRWWEAGLNNRCGEDDA